jgi:hypothetical protein
MTNHNRSDSDLGIRYTEYTVHMWAGMVVYVYIQVIAHGGKSHIYQIWGMSNIGQAMPASISIKFQAKIAIHRYSDCRERTYLPGGVGSIQDI